jgi:hypothetical protein
MLSPINGSSVRSPVRGRRAWTEDTTGAARFGVARTASVLKSAISCWAGAICEGGGVGLAWVIAGAASRQARAASAVRLDAALPPRPWASGVSERMRRAS